jgi:hypothetical protein
MQAASSDGNTPSFEPSANCASASERASAIFHEARHASGCGHNYQTTKDAGWSSGCAYQWSGQGAWAYSVLFMWWYNASANLATQSLKDRAADRANSWLSTMFQADPCFRIRSDGSSFNVC